MEQIQDGGGWVPPVGECFPKSRRQWRPEDDADGFEENIDFEVDDGRREMKGKGGVQSIVVIDKWGEKKVLDNDTNEEGYVPKS